MTAAKPNFASENFAGVHEEMMGAMIAANTGNVPSYGNDPITLAAASRFREVFGKEIDVYFTFNGTGANNFGLSCLVERHHSILCSDVAHLYVDESTAPETFTGCRLYPVTSSHGKMVVASLRSKIKRLGDPHHPQPRVVSLTQPTEYGTVYTLSELKAIKAICTENNMLLHVDGARFFNAAVCLGASLGQIVREAGIDIMTLGGTKTGMMFGEAVIFFNPAVNNAYKFNLKRSMQLASKNRFIAAQFDRMLQDGLWERIAQHTNGLARHFAQEIAEIPSIKLAHPVETNAVFITMPEELCQKMQGLASFYSWNKEKNETRFMFSFNNSMEEIDWFVRMLKQS